MLTPQQLKTVAKANGEKPIMCLVPGCQGKSWKHRHEAEYLCSKHFRLADAGWRTFFRRIVTAAEKSEKEGFTATEARRKAWDIWDRRIRPQALARAMNEPEPVEEAPPEPIEVRHVRAVKYEPDF